MDQQRTGAAEAKPLMRDNGRMSVKRRLWRIAVRAGAALLVFLSVAALAAHIRQARERAEISVGQNFFDDGGRKIRYRLEGADKPGPTIVILNGFLGCLEQWDDAQPVLSQIAPVLTYDRGGYGLSDQPAAYDANAQAEEMVDMLKVKGVRAPFVVVAFSSSALIARAFARLHPDLLAGLVFLDPTNPEQVIGLTKRQAYDRWALYERLPLLTLVKRVFGIRAAPATAGTAHPTPAQERAAILLSSASHWRAALGEGAAINDSAQESLLDWSKVKAPITLLSVAAATGPEYTRKRHEFYLKMVAASGARFLNPSGWTHDSVRNDPAFLPVIVDAVGTVVREARGEPTPPASAPR